MNDLMLLILAVLTAAVVAKRSWNKMRGPADLQAAKPDDPA